VSKVLVSDKRSQEYNSSGYMVIVLMLDRYLKGLILLFYVLKGFMSDEISQESDSSVYLLEGLMLDRDLKSVILVFMCSKA
jgi:hypothetical protein